MKSLQESLLDDDDKLFDDTSEKGLLLNTFPKKTDIANDMNYYYYVWESKYLKKITKLNIDFITVNWTHSNIGPARNIKLTLGKLNNSSSRYDVVILTDNILHTKLLDDLAYSIMEMMRDHVEDLIKLARFCSKKEFKFKPPHLYKIDLYDILNK